MAMAHNCGHDTLIDGWGVTQTNTPTMNITKYIRREMQKERALLNLQIDALIDSGKTKSKKYKALLVEHRKVCASLNK